MSNGFKIIKNYGSIIVLGIMIQYSLVKLKVSF